MNKKGFTLTEIILVVIIVGVLSLLASSTVIRHLNKSKKDAAFRNAMGYVNAINDYNFVNEGKNQITSGNTSTITPMLKDSFEGSRPKSGTVTINDTTHKVASADLVFGEYRIIYNGTKYTVNKN